MSRDRAPFIAQGTWRSGRLHVWGWNGESPASSAWMYSGFGRTSWDASEGWHELYMERSDAMEDARNGYRTARTRAGFDQTYESLLGARLVLP